MRFSKQITGAATAVALLVLLGCSAETGGQAIATSDSTATEVPEPGEPESKPDTFDPCDLPSALLDDLDLSGVAPVRLSYGNGCIWGNERSAVGLNLIEDTSLVLDPTSNALLSDVEMLPYENYTTYLFVMDGDAYGTQTMTKAGVVVINFTMIGAATLDVERQAMIDTFTALAPYLPPPQ